MGNYHNGPLMIITTYLNNNGKKIQHSPTWLTYSFTHNNKKQNTWIIAMSPLYNRVLSSKYHNVLCL